MSNTFLSDISVSRRNEITIRVSRKMKMNCRCVMEVTREITRELFATKFIHRNQYLLSVDIINLKETKFLKQWSSVITIACLVYYSYGFFCNVTILLIVLGLAQDHIKLQYVRYGKIRELYTKCNSLVVKCNFNLVIHQYFQIILLIIA